MVRQTPSPKRSTLTAAACCRWGMVVLLGLMLLLFSAVAAAELPLSTASSHTRVESPPDGHAHTELVNAEHPGPHCHHGHGWRDGGYALLRLARLDLEFEPLPLSMAAPATAPRVVTSSGTPRTLPDPSPVPVYLLTRRLRS